MKRSTRVILLSIACLLFIIIAPAVVLYAIGYRVNPANGIAHPVGVLLVATQPRGATVRVNGADIGQTPRAVPNLAPGTADLAVSLDGFRTWQKRVAIEATKATDFQNIRLFPLDPAQDRLAENVLDFALSPNELLIAAVLARNTVHIIDLHGLPISQFTLPAAPQKLTWSSDSSEILVATARRFYLINLNSASPVPLAGMPAGEILGWDPRLPDRLIVLTGGNSIVSYSTVTKETTPLIGNAQQAALTDNALYTGFDGSLKEYAYDGTLRQPFISPLPAGAIKLIASEGGTVAAVGKDKRITVLTAGTSEEVPVGAVSEAIFSPDGSLLLLQTAPNEVQIYNVNNELLPNLPVHTAQLLARLSRPIHHASWFAGNDHLLYQIDDELIITETDTRDYVLTSALDTTNTGDAKAAADGVGNTLFYIKKEGRTSTLIKMDLVGE